MISRKKLEILLSQNVKGFQEPKVELEQYQTSPRVAANLLHWAQHNGDITGKKIVDLCSGTGILGIGAALLDSKSVTVVEIDQNVLPILKKNQENLNVVLDVVISDALKWSPTEEYDTVLLNPPFGIQQKKQRDLDFVEKAATLGTHIYSIHDGSPKNLQTLPIIFSNLQLKVLDNYIENFSLPKKFPFHQLKRKIQKVVIYHSKVV